MKAITLIFTLLLLSSNFCNAQSKRTPTVLPDGGGYTEEELKSHEAKRKMEDEKQKLRSQAAKTASKEKLAEYNENLEREIKEALDTDAKNTIHLTGSDGENENRKREVYEAKLKRDTDYYSYVYSGISGDVAHQMVQDDIRRAENYKNIESGLNAAGMEIIAAFERRAERKLAERDEERKIINDFKKTVVQECSNIKAANNRYETDLFTEVNAKYPITNDIDNNQLRALALISGYQNYLKSRTLKGKFSQSLDEIASMTEGRKVTGSRLNMEGYAKQTINEYNFNENILTIDVTEELIKTEEDKSYIPHKYTVRSIIEYDILTDKSKIKRSVVWSNNYAIPSSGYLDNQEFNVKLKSINDPHYPEPSEIEFSISKCYLIIPNFLGSTLSRLHKLYLLEEGNGTLENEEKWISNSTVNSNEIDQGTKAEQTGVEDAKDKEMRRDLRAWNIALELKTIEGFNNYKNDYRNKEFRNEADKYLKYSSIKEIIILNNQTTYNRNFDEKEEISLSNIDQLKYYINVEEVSSQRDLNLTFIPESIGQLKNIKSLCLTNSSIAKVPDFMGNLQSLEVLNLSHNRIETVSSSIGKLTNLKELNLGGNMIKTIPQSIGNLKKLEVLCLGRKAYSYTVPNNRFTELPSSITDLTQLKKLVLNDCEISTLPESFGMLVNLEHLDLGGCRDFSKLPEDLGGLQKLTFLSLINTKISSLPVSIGELNSLEELVLVRCEFTQSISSLNKLTNLKKIAISKKIPSFIKKELKEIKKNNSSLVIRKI